MQTIGLATITTQPFPQITLSFVAYRSALLRSYAKRFPQDWLAPASVGRVAGTGLKSTPNTMNNQNIVTSTGPLGVKVTSTASFGNVDHEVSWKRGSSSLVFAANEGRLEINWRLVKDSDSDGYIKLPRTVWSWLENFQNGGSADRVASQLLA